MQRQHVERVPAADGVEPLQGLPALVDEARRHDPRLRVRLLDRLARAPEERCVVALPGLEGPEVLDGRLVPDLPVPYRELGQLRVPAPERARGAVAADQLAEIGGVGTGL